MERLFPHLDDPVAVWVHDLTRALHCTSRRRLRSQPAMKRAVTYGGVRQPSDTPRRLT